MSSPSNLYAEKIFAEHPLELWSLDDKTDYISLIPESFRDLTTWTKSAGTISDITDNFTESDVPISGTHISKIETTFGSGAQTITLTSASTFTSSDTFSIGMLIYANPYVTGVQVGYQIGSSTPVMSGTKSVHSLEWKAISNTFSISTSTTAKIVIKIFMNIAIAGIQDSYISGISAGVMSQEFSGASVGVIPINLSSAIPGVTSTSFIEAVSYSFDDNSGYYIVDGNKLRARSSTIPMVYGASNSTILSVANGGNPSLVIPGMQFLNSSGKLFDRTFECWLRINSSSTTPRKILGPTTSTDGLYINGPMLILKIGSTYGTHYVGEWSRPMLIDISVSKTKASLMVNAETVVSLNIDYASTDLPSSDNDWIGFYCYSDIPSIEVDCIAIYPYIVSPTMAKKRYVYAQGVVLPESTNTSYGGSSMAIDFKFANYDKNYSFPKDSKWEYGLLNNLKSDNVRLSLPNYDLPIVSLGGKSQDLWLNMIADTTGDTYALNDLSSLNRSIIRMRPSDEFSEVYPYILFDNFNPILGSKTAGIYGTFTVDSSSSNDQTLFLIKSSTTQDYLKVYSNGSTVKYSLNGNDIGSSITASGSGQYKKVCVGINLDFIKQSSIDGFRMFSDTSSLKVFVGGDDSSNSDNDYTFTGNVYGFGFLSSQNMSDISSLFNSNGTLKSTSNNFTYFKTYAPAYCLIATSIAGIVMLDILSSGTWEENIPMTLFKKQINNIDYLSFMQIDIDYPNMQIYSDGSYDTSGSLVRFFASFQRVSDGAVLSGGRTTVAMNSNGVVVPGSGWETETYEIVNGAIVYPPDLSSSDLLIDDINMIISSSFNVNGTISNNVSIRNISISSISFDDANLRQVGTKYGTYIYPFIEESVGGIDTYISSKNNPFKIYKGSSPYLYLTSQTGISIAGDTYAHSDSNYKHRGIIIKVNENKANPYSISAAIISIRNNDIEFSSVKKPLFEIEGNIINTSVSPPKPSKAYMRFLIVASDTDPTRGIISCEISLDDGNFQNYDKIDYYWNGQLTYQPEITTNEWGILALSFHEFINLDGKEGSFEFHGNQTIDNVSIYSASQSALQSSSTTNTWNTAKYSSLTWEHVLDTDGFETPTNNPADDNTWFSTNITLKSSTKPTDPRNIYRTYLGTNKFIVDTYESNTNVSVHNCEYVVFNTAGWYKNTIKPV